MQDHACGLGSSLDCSLLGILVMLAAGLCFIYHTGACFISTSLRISISRDGHALPIVRAVQMLIVSGRCQHVVGRTSNYYINVETSCSVDLFERQRLKVVLFSLSLIRI
jgi:hypothetical protein